MVRRSPAEFYLKYLLLHPAGYTTPKIKEICEELQLDYIDLKYLDRLRSKLRPPDDFAPQDVAHGPSQKFLIRERIQGAFHPDSLMRTADEILRTARLKEFVETMALTSAPFPVIARQLTTKRNFPCRADALVKYCHYFWNLELVDSTEARVLLAMRYVVDPSGGYRAEAMEREMKFLSMEDPRRVAATLPGSPVSALIAQLRMGIMPSKAELGELLGQAQTAAAVRVVESLLRGGRGDSTRAMEYMTVAKMSIEMLENVVKPDDKLLSELSVIALRTDNDQVTSISALSEGNHTVDIGPKTPTGEA